MKDENTNFKTSYTIRQGGTLVLGQDQDSVGGGFNADQSFQGMLSNVNIWNKALAAEKIRKMSQSCLLEEATDQIAYKWLDFVHEGGAKLVKPSPCQPVVMGK